MTFSIAGRRVRVDVGHLIFVIAVAGYCIWYLSDTRQASTSVQNLLLIQPAVILAVFLCLVIAWGLVSVERIGAGTARRAPDEPCESPAAAQKTARSERRDMLRVVAFVVLLAAYLLLMNVVGFDAATFLFVSASLLLQGERRISMIVLLPLVFAGVVVYGFKALLSIPVPTLLG